ncbi:MAG TPA: 4'-phosphopantetheinyl transferase superfamily protein [Candidatus Sulfotelmatobacter sp.]|jgi:4'-phosphopantetheinyl transferase
MANVLNISEPVFKFASPLTLHENEVQLWRADLDALAPEESRWQQILSTDERKRAARFHFAKDRQHFAAARAILRLILSGYLEIDPDHIDFRYSQKEKPYLAGRCAQSGIMFNVSHSEGVALYAVARGIELGVDVEFIRHEVEVESIARRFFSAYEQEQLSNLPSAERAEAFFRCWTRKEAYIKATGDGLSLPLSQFDVSLAPDSEDALLATRPDSKEAKQWLLREVPAGTGYLAALCARGRRWRLTSWIQG